MAKNGSKSTFNQLLFAFQSFLNPHVPLNRIFFSEMGM